MEPPSCTTTIANQKPLLGLFGYFMQTRSVRCFHRNRWSDGMPKVPTAWHLRAWMVYNNETNSHNGVIAIYLNATDFCKHWRCWCISAWIRWLKRCNDQLTRGVLNLSTSDFLKLLGLQDGGMESYPSTKLAAKFMFTMSKIGVGWGDFFTILWTPVSLKLFEISKCLQ